MDYKILSQIALTTEVEYGGQITRTLKIFTPLFHIKQDLCEYLNANGHDYSVNDDEMARDHGIGYYFRVVFNIKKEVEFCERFSDLIFRCETLIQQYSPVIERLMKATKLLAAYGIEVHYFRNDFCIGNMTRVPPDTSTFIKFRSPISLRCKLYDGSSNRFIQTIAGYNLPDIDESVLASALGKMAEDMQYTNSLTDADGKYQMDPIEVDCRFVDVISAKKELERLFIANGPVC